MSCQQAGAENVDPALGLLTSNGVVPRAQLNLNQLQQLHHTQMLGSFEDKNGMAAPSAVYKDLWKQAEAAAHQEISSMGSRRRHT